MELCPRTVPDLGVWPAIPAMLVWYWLAAVPPLETVLSAEHVMRVEIGMDWSLAAPVRCDEGVCGAGGVGL